MALLRLQSYILFSFLFANTHSDLLGDDELDALAQFFFATNGLNWLLNNGWNSLLLNDTNAVTNPCAASPRNWFGVSCQNIRNESHVIKITLPNNNLISNILPTNFLSNLSYLESLDLDSSGFDLKNMFTGDISNLCQLSPSIINISLSQTSIIGSFPSCLNDVLFPNIEVLQLSQNFINGTTPIEICRLSSLEVLDVSGNLISGTLPECIGELQTLKLLRYSSGDQIHLQSISGTIPLSICNLSKLEILEFRFNHGLIGSLPNCLGMNQFHLKSIDFSASKLKGTIPPSLGFSAGLQTLNLAYNSLTGTIPSFFVKLSNLNSLDLAGNFISGSISNFMCDLKSLSLINLGFMNLNGSIPDCMNQLSDLESLSINSNELTGSFPSSLCQCSKLSIFNASTNSLEGAIPTCIGEMTSLYHLFLSYNVLSGPLPDSIGLLDIIWFDLSVNRISGTLPRSLCSLDFVQSIYFNSNLFSGTIPNCIGNISNLEFVGFEDNRLTGTIPDAFCTIEYLAALELNSNLISGSIPTCLETLKFFFWLDVSSNMMTGSIPQELCGMSSVSVMSLNDNSFTGTIPACLASLSFLGVLALSSNQLTGTFPLSACNMSHLEYLVLDDNQLTGTIPNCIGDLSNLVWFILSDNLITGTLPHSICLLAELTNLELNHNWFEGTIPACFGTDLTSLGRLFLHENNLHGTIPSSWSLTLLEGIVLSNNKKLRGIIPDSLFHQLGEEDNENTSEDTKNQMLTFVVVEGTRVSGSIPLSVCDVVNLQTLILSGNKLSGSIPKCISVLHMLETFRAPSNKISGSLIQNIDNMSSLHYLDLSQNFITGTLPHELGVISSQLIEVSLSLNQISCDLPNSVLHWEKSANFKKLDILDGNLFGCPGPSLFALSMVTSKSSGLVSANKKSAQLYSCGGSAYVIPIVLPISVILSLCLMYWICSKKGLIIRTSLFPFSNLAFFEQIASFQTAYLEMQYLLRSILCVCVISFIVILPVVLAAHSPYSCQYSAVLTIESKESSHDVFSVGVGLSVGSALVVGSFVWWRRLLISKKQQEDYYENDEVEDVFKSIENQSSNESSDQLLDLLIQNKEFTENLTDSNKSSLFDKVLHVLYLIGLFITIATFSIGPNIVYVFVIIGNYSYNVKLASTILIALFKVSLGTVFIPMFSDRISGVLPNVTMGYRHRLYVNVGYVISAISLVIAPIFIVGLSDTRCLYYYLYPQPKVTNEFPYEDCQLDVQGGCLQSSTFTVESTYTPNFDYDGGRCVGAMLSTYVPVFLASVLLSAPISAAIDLLVVPLCAPWCYANRETSNGAKWGLSLLRSISWNVLSVLLENSEVVEPHELLDNFDIDRYSICVVRRAFVQCCPTLLVALTFGLSAPMIGVACSFAAVIQFKHHTLMFQRAVELGQLIPVPLIPEITHCNYIPNTAGFTVVLTALIFWFCIVVDYMNDVVVVLTGAGTVFALFCLSSLIRWLCASNLRGTK